MFSVLVFFFEKILYIISEYFFIDPKILKIEQINELLPQIQCAQCGYPGCKPYAEAICNGDDINKCIPGGEETVFAISEFMNVSPPQKNNNFLSFKENQIAWIDESKCIGCTKCVSICPIDSIVGAMYTIHTVISNICIGCRLCIESCPTKCIVMRTFDSNKK